jgi:hypothetical protein
MLRIFAITLVERDRIDVGLSASCEKREWFSASTVAALGRSKFVMAILLAGSRSSRRRLPYVDPRSAPGD